MSKLSPHEHTIERNEHGHIVVTFGSTREEPFRVAFTDHGAAGFVHDLSEAIDLAKVQISFRQAVEDSNEMSPEDKAYWLDICDKEGV